MVKKILVGSGILAVIGAHSQDLHFSQINQLNTFNNPAFTCVMADQGALLAFKQQWKQIDNGYRTYFFAFEQRITKAENYLAVGLNVFNDKAGVVKSSITGFNLTSSYHLTLDKNSKFGAGLNVGLVQNRINLSGLTWGNQYDGLEYNGTLSSGENTSTLSQSYLGSGAGLSYVYSSSEKYSTANNHKRFFIGAGIQNLFPSKKDGLVQSEQTPMRITASFMGNIGVPNSKLSLLPTLHFNLQNATTEVLGGLVFKIMLQESSRITGFNKAIAFYVGGFTRNGKDIIPYAGLDLDVFRLGFSYDLNLAGYGSASNSNGGLELLLRYTRPSELEHHTSKRFL